MSLAEAAPCQKETPFQFLSSLARELSTGRVELPSFPDVAARTQHVLSDDSVNNERIAREFTQRPDPSPTGAFELPIQ